MQPCRRLVVIGGVAGGAAAAAKARRQSETISITVLEQVGLERNFVLFSSSLRCLRRGVNRENM